MAGVEPESLTPIERRATEEDLAEGRTNEKLAREATEFCRQCIRDRRLDMKLVGWLYTVLNKFHDRRDGERDVAF